MKKYTIITQETNYFEQGIKVANRLFGAFKFPIESDYPRSYLNFITIQFSKKDGLHIGIDLKTKVIGLTLGRINEDDKIIYL